MGAVCTVLIFVNLAMIGLLSLLTHDIGPISFSATIVHHYHELRNPAGSPDLVTVLALIEVRNDTQPRHSCKVKLNVYWDEEQYQQNIAQLPPQPFAAHYYSASSFGFFTRHLCFINHWVPLPTDWPWYFRIPWNFVLYVIVPINLWLLVELLALRLLIESRPISTHLCSSCMSRKER
jgi:hypothetical protein